MLDFYRSLTTKERVLVWVAGIAALLWVFASVGDGAGIVAGAQVAAAVGTFILAGLAFSQVREMREARIVQDRPQIIVDADYSRDPVVNVVVRNIGKGAARDITFEFSHPLVSSLSLGGRSDIPPVNEFSFFKEGVSFLAPGGEIVTFWDTTIALIPLLRERGLEDGITITSKYWSLNGEYHETPWNINPLRMDIVVSNEKSMKDLVKAVEKIQKDLNKVVGNWHRELKVSTETEREDRKRRERDARERDEGRGGDDEQR